MNEEAKQTSMIVRFLVYVMGFLIMTLGIAISVKSDLGVSPVSSIPYTMTCVWGIEMGKATILFHAGLVLLQIILLRRAFQMKNLLQIPVGILFGYLTTFSNYLMTFLPDPGNIAIRLVMMLVSTLLIAIGIFFYVPMDLVPLAGEGAMLAIAQITKKPFSTIKLIFDISMVVISLITCLVLIHALGSVGLGTVIAAMLVGINLKFITRKFGALRDRIFPVHPASRKASEDSEISGIPADSGMSDAPVTSGDPAPVPSGISAKAPAPASAKNIPLTDLMKKDVYTVSGDAPLTAVLELLTGKGISGVPVTDANQSLIGFISDGDILRFLAAEHLLYVNPSSLMTMNFDEKLGDLMHCKVRDIARKSVITVDERDDLGSVCHVLSSHHIKKAPVLSDGKMVGIINASNITKYAFRRLEHLM